MEAPYINVTIIVLFHINDVSALLKRRLFTNLNIQIERVFNFITKAVETFYSDPFQAGSDN